MSAIINNYKGPILIMREGGYYKQYTLKEKLHNPKGPAYVSYYQNENRRVQVELYCINGKRHREDGPARITYFDNDSKSIQKTEFFINGKAVPNLSGYHSMTYDILGKVIDVTRLDSENHIDYLGRGMTSGYLSDERAREMESLAREMERLRMALMGDMRISRSMIRSMMGIHTNLF